MHYLQKKLHSIKKLTRHSRSGFTLVELIVVIAILAILATIGFITMSNQASAARDGKRISEIRDLANSSRLKSAQLKKLPIPSSDGVTLYVDETGTGGTGSFIGYQGFMSSAIAQSFGYSADATVDPLDKTPYTYRVNQIQDKSQFLAYLEAPRFQRTVTLVQNEMLTPLIVGAQKILGLEDVSALEVDASIFADRYPYAIGDPLGILLNKSNNSPIQAGVTGLDTVTIDPTSDSIYKLLLSEETIASEISLEALLSLKNGSIEEALKTASGSENSTPENNPTTLLRLDVGEYSFGEWQARGYFSTDRLIQYANNDEPLSISTPGALTNGSLDGNPIVEFSIYNENDVYISFRDEPSFNTISLEVGNFGFECTLDGTYYDAYEFFCSQPDLTSNLEMGDIFEATLTGYNTNIEGPGMCGPGETWNGIECVSSNPEGPISCEPGQVWNGIECVGELGGYMCNGENEYDTSDGCLCVEGYKRDESFQCVPYNLGDSLDDILTVYNITPGSYGVEDFIVRYTSEPVTMSISTGEYRINGGTWTSHTIPATVTNEDFINIRMSPTAMDQQIYMEVSLGEYTKNWEMRSTSCYPYTGNGEITIYGYTCGDSAITIPSELFGEPVRYIADNSNFPNITSITLPEGIISIGVRAFEGANITSIDIPASVQTIGRAAFFGSDLTSVNFLGAPTSIGRVAFYNTPLTSLSLPEGIVSIGDNAFGYTNITSLILPNSLTSLGDEAFFPSNINSLQIGIGLSSIPYRAFMSNDISNLVIPSNIIEIGAQSFGSNNISTLSIPSSTVNIGDGAFADNNLTNLVIPEGISIIDSCVFCSNQLTSVTLPSTLTEIRNNAFSSNQLTSITIPTGVTMIGRNAFVDNSLTSVTLPNTISEIGEFAFDYQENSLGNGNIYGPSTGYVKDTYDNNSNSQFDKTKLTNYIDQ